MMATFKLLGISICQVSHHLALTFHCFSFETETGDQYPPFVAQTDKAVVDWDLRVNTRHHHHAKKIFSKFLFIPFGSFHEQSWINPQSDGEVQDSADEYNKNAKEPGPSSKKGKGKQKAKKAPEPVKADKPSGKEKAPAEDFDLLNWETDKKSMHVKQDYVRKIFTKALGNPFSHPVLLIIDMHFRELHWPGRYGGSLGSSS